MSFLSIVYALLFYVSTIVLIAGLARKILTYARVPAPLRIPTTPAPLTRTGVAGRMALEVICFSSLFKASVWTWLLGWVFHAALLLVVLGHLPYFIDSVWSWVAVLQRIGKYTAVAMLLGLAGLWLRRLLVERVRYISSLSDHLMLALLIGIGASGLLMRTVMRPDIVGLKNFVLGVMAFDWQPLPPQPVLIVHLTLVYALLLVFPFSKLLHAPGVFFSPTLNQADNPRERRHLAGWAAELERPEDASGG